MKGDRGYPTFIERETKNQKLKEGKVTQTQLDITMSSKVNRDTN